MYRVMLVDDEPNILSALRRSLGAIDVRRLDGEALRFETFTTPEAAIKRAEEQEFDLVVSDYRMPTMNGVQFLMRMMKIQPAAPRIIVSAFADRDVIISAVNRVHLIRFIEKPWSDYDLREAVVSILCKGKVKSERGEPMVDRGDDGGIDLDFDDA